jgi:hypothetical protein
VFVQAAEQPLARDVITSHRYIQTSVCWKAGYGHSQDTASFPNDSFTAMAAHCAFSVDTANLLDQSTSEELLWDAVRGLPDCTRDVQSLCVCFS